jgi:alpha-beta hydrolase superfamily lysophospholipase
MIHFSQLRQYLPVIEKSWQQPLDEQARDYVEYYGIDFDRRFDNIKQSIGRFSSGEFDLVYQSFITDTTAPTCIVVHGYYDHSGLYKHLIDWCLQQRFNVVLFDLPGHGLSGGEVANIHSFSCYIDALHRLRLLVEDRVSGPIYLFGQSTGGAAVMTYLLENPNVVDKAVLMAPLIRPHAWATKRWGHWLLKRSVSDLQRTFTLNSHDQEFLDFLSHKDPLQCRKQPLEWISSMARWIERFNQLPLSELRVLVIQGTGDYTVDWRHNLPIVRSKFPRAKMTTIEAMRHHVVCESEYYRRQAFSAIERYLIIKT